MIVVLEDLERQCIVKLALAALVAARTDPAARASRGEFISIIQKLSGTDVRVSVER